MDHESGGSRGRVAASNVDRLTSHLLQLWRQVQDEVARVGHALISWLAGCSGVVVISAWLVFPSKSSETHYGGSSSEFPTVKSANVIDYPIHLDGAHRPKENPAVLVRNSLASSGPLTSSLLDAERQGIVHKHAGHLLRTKLSDDVVSAVAV
ncbi:hypothetical protein KRP22_012915 [Phytophthora ramorum]|nr:hypothetical protein KRP22_8657 [Phytophthora ramorum]